MKKIFDKIFHDDIAPYEYLLSEKEKKNYFIYKLQYAFVGIIVGVVFGYQLFGIGYLSLLGIILTTFIGYKVPYILLIMRHRQRGNEVVDAIPLWVNMIYSLIEVNNIYNAIVESYEDAPKAIKEDLKEFIDKITLNNEDKDAYMNFLKKYDVEGFRDIMLKLYEFRNLSKDKLKYEITSLNSTLGKLEKLKREKRFKSELFSVDILAMVMVMIPCMYMFFVSLLMSDVMM